ncbi:MAG: hypothetical protein IJD13_06255 [Oscillospiraceae bacterium]|nr:hypothetical protein [Oscillospiraceae bacterium]
MTNIVFSFDTEDYVNEKGADGIVRAGRILRENGIKGCYNVVGWLAEALEKWGREDAIEELRLHETETHSLRHSYHPTICEYTDIEDFDKAMRIFRENEESSLGMVRRVVGNEAFHAACPPGFYLSYVGYYGYADMGFKLVDGSNCVYDEKSGRVMNICNIGCLPCKFSADSFLRWDRPQILEMIEKIAKLENVILFHHPQKSTLTTFCDKQNFDGYNTEGEWQLSDLLPEETVRKFEENFRFFVETIKADPRFHIVTCSDIVRENADPERTIRPSDIPALKAALEEDFFPVTEPGSFCLSDILLASRDLLLGKEEHHCGKVYGFMDVPYAVTQPVKVTAEELRESAAQIRDGEFLPTVIEAGGKKLGPADWLRAALQILSGSEQAVIVPDKWQIDLNEFPMLRDLCYRGTWIHSPELEDRFISDRLRLQSWTIRLPKGSTRRIY